MFVVIFSTALPELGYAPFLLHSCPCVMRSSCCLHAQYGPSWGSRSRAHLKASHISERALPSDLRLDPPWCGLRPARAPPFAVPRLRRSGCKLCFFFFLVFVF